MFSRETSIGPRAPFAAIVGKELRDLAAGRAFWVMLVLLSLLVGASFDQTVSLYAEASRAAVQTPLLARGLSPFDGIVVPTFGALYLAATFLLPFVVIRMVGAEKANGALKLMLQMPYSQGAVIGAKLVASLVAWIAMVLVPLSALGAWALMGGHIAAGETANLLLGHLLYAVAITGIAMLCAAVSDNTSTAAILALAATIGFWVLDFAAAGQGGIMQTLAGLSLTQILRGFERGLLSTAPALAAVIASLGVVVIAAVWLHSGRALARKLALTAATVVCAGLAVIGVTVASAHIDMTEDRRNSFPPSETAGLRQLTAPLDVIVRLAPEDPRLVDFERGVLGKLRRTVRRMNVAIESESRTGLFAISDEHYGEIVLRYAGRETTTRSTGAGEVLPIIFELAGITPPNIPAAAPYPGYPLIAETTAPRIWFFAVLPLLIIAMWAISSRQLDEWRRWINIPKSKSPRGPS